MSAAGSTASNPPGTSDRIAARSGGAAVGAAGWRAPVLLAIAACALFAYRGVLAVGTAAGSGLPEAEAFMFEPSASSPTLVFAATLWMLARRWHWLRASLGAPPRRLLGSAALAASGALAAWAWAVAVPAFLLPSLSFLLVGAGLWLGGTAALRVLWLPALFILFAYPMPVAIVNHVVYPLQLAVAKTTSWILGLGGSEVLTEGDRLAFRGVVFQVIESCSGLRGTETILMSSVLYVELFHQTRLRSALIVAGAPVIGLLANQVRVLTIVLNPYSQIAAVHTAQGLVMIVLAVLMLAVWDALLGRILPAPGPPRRARLPERRPLPAARLALLGAFALALAAGSLAIEPWQPPAVRRTPLATLPVELNGQRVAGLRLDKQFMGSTAFSEWVHRRYGEGERAVEVFAGADARESGGVRLLSQKTAVVESGWTVVDEGTTRLASGREVQWLELRSGAERKLAWHWREGVGTPAEELVRGLLALDRSPLRRPGRAVAVRVATPLGAGGRAEAEARLAGAAAEIEASLAQILSAPAGSAAAPGAGAAAASLR